MKFFVPKCETIELALEVWESIRQYCKDYTEWEINDRKIYSLLYFHEGGEQFVKVGEEHPRNGEIVRAIFESNTYLICTRNRGVKTGEPIMVGVGKVSDVEEFE